MQKKPTIQIIHSEFTVAKPVTEIIERAIIRKSYRIRMKQ